MPVLVAAPLQMADEQRCELEVVMPGSSTLAHRRMVQPAASRLNLEITATVNPGRATLAHQINLATDH